MTLIGMHLYVFGGGDETLSFNDVHTLHVGNMAWDKPLLHGTLPSPRSRHSATALGNNMVVFGGVGGGNDLHILEARRRARASAYPPPRRHPRPTQRHTHATPTPTCHLRVHQTDTLTWYVPKVGGEPPLPRFGHTCNLVESKVRAIVRGVLCLSATPRLPCHMVTTKGRLVAHAQTPNPNPGVGPEPN